MLTSIHIFHHRYFCIRTHVVQADICLHPCECSHLERHCIHTYTHKYTYIKNHITDTLVYQPVLCTLTLVCALASAHTENLFVYMHGLTRLHKSHIHLYMSPCCANSHMSVPLPVLTLRTSLHTYICHKYTITDMFVYQPVLCNLTLVRAIAGAHT